MRRRLAARTAGLRHPFAGGGAASDELLGTAVDEVRRAEQKERPELVGSGYVWLKNAGDWTRSQRELFERLSPARLNLKTARAHRIKLAFQEFWTLSVELAEPFLKRWYRWAMRSRLPAVVDAARTIKRHRSGIPPKQKQPDDQQEPAASGVAPLCVAQHSRGNSASRR